MPKLVGIDDPNFLLGWVPTLYPYSLQVASNNSASFGCLFIYPFFLFILCLLLVVFCFCFFDWGFFFGVGGGG